MFKKITTAVKNFVQKIIQKVKKISVSVLSHIRKNWMVYTAALVVAIVIILIVLAEVGDRRFSSDLAKTFSHREAVDLELDRILQDPEIGDAWNKAVNTIQGIIGKAESGLV